MALGILFTLMQYTECSSLTSKHRKKSSSFTGNFSRSHDTVANTNLLVLGVRMFSLGTICDFLQIAPENCTCASTPLVCELTDFKKNRQQNGTRKYPFKRDDVFTITYATIAVTSSVFGIIGNIAVIYIAFQQGRGISICKLHIAELAVVNFLFSAVQLVNVLPLYWTNAWIYGKAMCKLTKGILEAGSLLSSGFFQLITIERYLLVVRTFNVDKMQRHERLIVGCLIVLVTATVTPYIMGIQIEPGSQRCVNIIGEERWLSQAYTFFAFVVYSVLPIGITSVLVVNLILHFQQEASSSSFIDRKDLNKKILKHMLLVFFLFIVCTLPSRLVSIYMNMAYFKSSKMLLGFQFLSYTLYSLQGTLNPILYSMLAREWRRSLSQVVRSKFRKSEGGSVRISIVNYVRVSIVNHIRVSVTNH